MPQKMFVVQKIVFYNSRKPLLQLRRKERGMSVKEVSARKFDALVAKGISLRECPVCRRYGGQIIIDMPMYGKDGVYCKCYQCEFKTKRRAMGIVMVDNENHRMATPVIEKSLIGAINQAVNDWNGRSGNGK